MSKAQQIDEPVLPMSREEYRAWAEQQPRGRFERINGIVVQRDGASATAPERVIHARIKFRAAQALDRAIRLAGVPCEALPDGLTVEVGDSDYEPDAIVQCGPLDPNGVVADNPVVIVEVLSPSSRTSDRTVKLAGYFKLPSLHHYLIVWPDKQQVVHHLRGEGSTIDTRVVTAGEIRLDPPGITITVEDIYAA
jgi:Uma2 family endonuclease